MNQSLRILQWRAVHVDVRLRHQGELRRRRDAIRLRAAVFLSTENGKLMLRLSPLCAHLFDIL